MVRNALMDYRYQSTDPRVRFWSQEDTWPEDFLGHVFLARGKPPPRAEYRQVACGTQTRISPQQRPRSPRIYLQLSASCAGRIVPAGAFL